MIELDGFCNVMFHLFDHEIVLEGMKEEISQQRCTITVLNNCFSRFSSNSLQLISPVETSSNRDIFFTDDAAKNFFPTSKISAQKIRHQFFLIWSNLTIMAYIMGLGNQSESWKIIILS